ncbi:odorant receptor Or1-like [Leptopilina heterotoma]|uniref:odorant receptor Or1-like n=1 Tax=Leptopilina heterotoma TaxID=63436 RepID=UPI001CA8A3A3|nr:odorant receptor Or1-like [Leptopilina heterotoma]
MSALYLGEFSYAMFQFFGFWRPVNLFQTHESIENLIQSIFYCCTFLTALIKLALLFRTRQVFIESNEMFLSEICQPLDDKEIAILQESSRIGRNVTTLPLPTWLPYSLDDSKLVFSLSYLHQSIGIIMTVTISVAMESLALTMSLQICGQLEIIIHRLNLIPELCEKNYVKSDYREAELTKRCVKHHLFVYSLGNNLNKQFGLVIFTQFFASMINLCAIIFSLAKLSVTSRTYWIMFFSVGSYTFQIFIYCFYGDKVMEKSSEIGTAIYFLNWCGLTIRTKKNLITIMIRSTRPIQLTGASFVTMSIDTFMKIIKSAYSAYNLLKRQ